MAIRMQTALIDLDEYEWNIDEEDPYDVAIDLAYGIFDWDTDEISIERIE